MDHDGLFKELISAFFVEFIDLFLPQLGPYLDRDADIVRMDKEVISDITSRRRHEVDLLMKVKFRDHDAFFLIHVENQASAQADFPRRMFRYFARLTEKHALPVYPVAIFSHDRPARREPAVYEVSFPDTTVLKFRYRVIQLGRIPWRRFIDSDNPLASALMAKMKMAPADRPRVKLQCLRLLASSKLDPARSELIAVFVDSYLSLTEHEAQQYQRELEQLSPKEREETMELRTSWGQEGLAKGLAKGRAEGKEEMLRHMIRRHLGDLPDAVSDRIGQLSAEQLDDLGVALFDIDSMAGLDRWLSQHMTA